MTPGPVTLYHNPRCSKSRAALALLRGNGVEPRIVEYLQTPPGAAEILDLARKAGVPLHALVRADEDEYAAAGLSPAATETALAQAIARDPVLLQRPIAVRGARAVVGRPPERVLELLR